MGRHRFLSEHFCRLFEAFDLETIPCAGMRQAIDLVPDVRPDVVICDYDLLATACLTQWELDPAFARTPVITVSLTRQPAEAHLLDIDGIAGFLYLPTLHADDAHRLLAAVRRKNGGTAPPNVLTWPGTKAIAQLR
ncbi:MAG TPA: hypothetical protein VH277_00955 [Gemmatimonadaceae bacterium]|nr:hypothetical protein [Gemmatimonadaceae bacterium]